MYVTEFHTTKRMQKIIRLLLGSHSGSGHAAEVSCTPLNLSWDIDGLYIESVRSPQPAATNSVVSFAVISRFRKKPRVASA